VSALSVSGKAEAKSIKEFFAAFFFKKEVLAF
jgi:hypothetical protein